MQLRTYFAQEAEATPNKYDRRQKFMRRMKGKIEHQHRANRQHKPVQRLISKVSY